MSFIKKLTTNRRARQAHEASVKGASASHAERVGTGPSMKRTIDAVDEDEDKETEEATVGIGEILIEDKTMGEDDDPTKAAARKKRHVPPPPQVKQEEAKEDASSTMDGTEAEEEDGEEPVREFLVFPVPAGTDPVTTWGNSAGDVVHMYADEPKVKDLPVELRPAMYIFDHGEQPREEASDDEESEGAKVDRDARNREREEHNKPVLLALKAANSGFPTVDRQPHLSALYEPLDPPEMPDGQAYVPLEPVKYIGRADYPRFHASWPYHSKLVTSASAMDAMESKPMRAEFPFPASAQKKHFMQFQSKAERCYYDAGAFSIPLRGLPVGAMVLSAKFTSEPVITLGPHIEYAATLASTHPTQGFQGNRENPPDATEGTTFYALSKEHAALYNSPEFRRWAGIDASEEKAKIRTQARVPSGPDDDLLDKTLQEEGLLKDYVKVPLLEKPRTLAELIVASHADELHAASLNMRRGPSDPRPDKPLILNVDMLMYSQLTERAKSMGYHGHVLVHLDALDAVIDYYCAKFHPAQFAARHHLLKIIPKGRGMYDIKAMADAESVAGGIYEYARMYAHIEVAYIPYKAHIHRRPWSVDALEQTTALFSMAMRDGTMQELAAEMHEEGLDVTDQSKNPCFEVMMAKFAARKLEERKGEGEQARIDRENDWMHEEFIPRAGEERRAQDATGMKMVPPMLGDPDDGGDKEW